MGRRTVWWSMLALLGGCAGETGVRDTDGGGDTQSEASSPTDSATETESDSGPPPAFGPEEEFELRLAGTDVPPLTLQMDRDEVAELFGDRADEVLLLQLDSSDLLRNTLEEVKASCGNSWQLDNEDPQHNCDLTELGASFEGPDGTWRTSAEYAMVRILTMTPANVDVSGTSSSALASLADALGIGGGYGEILSEALGIGRTQEIVSTDALVAAFQAAFVGSHPNIGEGATLDFYLSDALSDLSTMTVRLGATGDHPGLVDPAFEVSGEVFGPAFRMNAIAESNLRLVDGLDGDGGKGFLTVIEDRVGPTFDDELEFDFSDPERFSLEGVIEDLRADMRFQILEHDSYIWSCLGPPCTSNLPGAPAESGSVWGIDPWMLEYNVALASYEDYKARTFEESYLLGTASIELGQNGNPPGWTEYSVPFNIGSPPEDQYVWETILEVAQVALHRTPFTVITEGAGDVAFTVRDIPIGVSGSEAADAVRPFLQEQASELSDFILGNFKDDNDRVDVYWRRGENDRPYLFFADASDLSDDAAYSHDNPGFFAAADLNEGSRLSNTAVPGLADTMHEKYEPPAGESTAYFEDDQGVLYRLRIVRADADAETLQVFLSTGGE